MKKNQNTAKETPKLVGQKEPVADGVTDHSHSDRVKSKILDENPETQAVERVRYELQLSLNSKSVTENEAENQTTSSVKTPK